MRLFIDRGLQIDPKSINFNQLKVKNLYKNKQFDSVLVYLNRLEDLGFKTKFTYTYYGLAYHQLDSLKKAENYLKKARKLGWDDAQVLYYLGLVEKEQGKLRDAELNFMMSIAALRPKVDKQYFELGLIELEKKNPERAIQNFKKSYQNNSKNYKALFHWAITADHYYKDQKICFNLYKKYLDKFSKKDKALTAFCEQRMREIRKELFKEGVTVE